MIDDSLLLRRYASERSEEAFAELVRRHLALVYHAALRQGGGDAHRAEDVAQTVFVALGRQAARLAEHRSLAGWLHTATRYAAIQAVRSETRRQTREQQFQAMNDASEGGGSALDWDKLRPFVDETLHALREDEREAVLLRFFEGRPFAEIGAQLDVTEDAARMRVDRALEKMRRSLARHGVTSTGAALSAILANQAGAAVPAGLAWSVTTAVLGSGSLAGVATFMTITKLQAGLVIAVLVAGTAGLVYQQQVNQQLAAQVSSLRDAGVENGRLRAQNQQLTKAIAPAAMDRGGAMDSSAPTITPSANVSVGPRAIPSPAQRGVVLAKGLSPVDSLGNLGRATAQNTFATQLWAARTGDVDLEASTLLFTPESRARLEAARATLPGSLQAQYDSPEKMMAFALAGSPHPVAGMQVLDETAQGPDDVELQTQWQHADDSIVHQSSLQFHRADDGWKMRVPDVLVSRAVAYITRQAQTVAGNPAK